MRRRGDGYGAASGSRPASTPCIRVLSPWRPARSAASSAFRSSTRRDRAYAHSSAPPLEELAGTSDALAPRRLPSLGGLLKPVGELLLEAALRGTVGVAERVLVREERPRVELPAPVLERCGRRLEVPRHLGEGVEQGGSCPVGDADLADDGAEFVVLAQEPGPDAFPIGMREPPHVGVEALGVGSAALSACATPVRRL